MFKSIQNLKYIGKDPKTKLYSYLYKITDDDFEEEVVGTADRASDVSTGKGACAVITCYENKNLNIGNNLLLLFKFYEKEYGSKYYSIQQQISWCIKYQPLFPKYKEDVEKYLSLI